MPRLRFLSGCSMAVVDEDTSSGSGTIPGIGMDVAPGMSKTRRSRLRGNAHGHGTSRKCSKSRPNNINIGQTTPLYARRLRRYLESDMFVCCVAHNGASGGCNKAGGSRGTLVVPMLYEVIGSDVVAEPEDVEMGLQLNIWHTMLSLWERPRGMQAWTRRKGAQIVTQSITTRCRP
jgi:hypothetical protein